MKTAFPDSRRVFDNTSHQEHTKDKREKKKKKKKKKKKTLLSPSLAVDNMETPFAADTLHQLQLQQQQQQQEQQQQEQQQEEQEQEEQEQQQHQVAGRGGLRSCTEG
ncbi:hypothetical protein EPH_0033440 [Eimeria praecox]|uniref:Uncharacterized protein n=1 Tax=Eimeria praecox TaxID=51316 RepID=U6G727_9EIME|nr:hypothetical protein EPH_0033440 [Eimeria praecox]